MYSRLVKLIYPFLVLDKNYQSYLFFKTFLSISLSLFHSNCEQRKQDSFYFLLLNLVKCNQDFNSMESFILFDTFLSVTSTDRVKMIFIGWMLSFYSYRIDHWKCSSRWIKRKNENSYKIGKIISLNSIRVLVFSIHDSH